MRTSFTRASMMAFNGGERGGMSISPTKQGGGFGGVNSNLNISSVTSTTARPADSSILDISRNQ